jgi:23S rRNA (uridine2552-2'-O)-methyltransferase
MTTDDKGDGKRRWSGKDLGSNTSGRVTKARERVKSDPKPSSRKWIERQLNDPYVRKTLEAGYRSRAAFKLREIDEKFSILKKGARVIDLGCAPGGWVQVALLTGAAKVVGVDLLETEPLNGAEIFIGDVEDEALAARLIDALGGRPHIVLSDMAANTTGHKQTDHLRTVALADIAAEFALEWLEPGGTFVTKVFQGGADNDLLMRLKLAFTDVRHVKPPASRKASPELYLVATGFRGRQR